MILDKLLQFDPTGTALTSTAVSTNTLDLLNARDIAVGASPPGEVPLVRVTPEVALTSGGATTLTVQVQGSVDNSSWTTYGQSDAIPKASLTAGNDIDIPLPFLPPHAAGLPRYLRLNYVVATGPFTGGTIQANLIMGSAQQSNPPSYPPGITVNN